MIYESTDITPAAFFLREIMTGISAGPVSDSVRHWCMVVVLIVSWYVHTLDENQGAAKVLQRSSLLSI